MNIKQWFPFYILVRFKNAYIEEAITKEDRGLKC